MDNQDDVLQRIDALKEVIRKTPPDMLKERVYICMANGCILLTAYKRMKGEKGWSSKLHDEFDQPMLTSQQQADVEKAFASAPWILDVLETNSQTQEPVQEGGFHMKVPSLQIPGSQILEDNGEIKLTGQDVSMDALFEKFLEKSEQMDQFWGKFAYESPGFAKKINTDIRIYKDVEINAQPIVNLLVLLLDSIRLSYGLAGQKSQVLTTLILLEEVFTGQWRQMILTAVGFLSPTGMAIGVLFKYMVNAWTLINPDLRTQIVKDTYKGTKSVFLGFLLWTFSNLSPLFLREKIEAVFARVREKVEAYDQKLKTLEESASAKLASQGKQIRLRGVDLSQLKTLSLHDIQNLQALATWDVFICSSEFQELITPMEASPIMRLILELMNIPTIPADKFAMCGEPPYKSMDEEVQDSLTPVIEDTPEVAKAKEVATEHSEEPEVSKEVPAETPQESEAPLTIPALPAIPPVPTLPPALPVKVGGKVFKLKKKSTRYRKATPRRATRRS